MLPSTSATIGSAFQYAIVATNAPTAAGGVSYSNNAVCPSSGATATARNYELQVYLEQGGSYCVDNH